MDIRNQILTKYNEFSVFLEGVNLDELKGQLSRKELDEFAKEIRKFNIRNIPYEIDKITETMKKEEYPQLLGVHHFPVINSIEFLSENEKIELDKYLVMHRVGNYVGGLWKITRNETRRKQLEKWLLENGVVEDVYAILCPRCYDGYLSTVMTREQKEEFDEHFKRYKDQGDWDDYEKVSGYVQYICMECDSETEVDELQEVRYKEMYKMKMNRDTSLDNV